MKNLKKFIITFCLLIIGGSTLFIGILMNTPLSPAQLSGLKSEQTVQPLQQADSSFLEDLYTETPSFTPTLGIQAGPLGTIFANHTLSQRGTNDTLRFSMQFTANETSYHNAEAIIYTNTSVTTQQQILYDSWGDTVVVGNTVTAIFDFCGYEIRNAGFDGPYAMYVKFYYWDQDQTIDRYLYGNSSVYEFVGWTQDYKATDFHSSPLSVDSITSSFVDDDGNGLYEWIDVNLHLTVDITDQYNFQANLRFNNGSTSSQGRWLSIGLSTGSQTATVRFSTWYFGEMGVWNTNMTVDYLYISHNTNPYWMVQSGNPMYFTTEKYNSTNFDRFPYEPTGRMWEEPYDSDGDQDYDSYRVKVEVNKTRIDNSITSCSLRAELYVNSTDNYLDSAYVYQELIQPGILGLTNVTFEFCANSYEIYQTGMVDDNFLLNAFYGEIYSNVGVDNSYNYYYGLSWISPQSYNYTDFDSPPAQFGGNYNNYGADTDGDGLFNLLIVEVQVNVTQEDDFTLDGYIYGGGMNNIWSNPAEYYLPLGENWVNLTFDGYEIHRSGTTGISIQIGAIYLNEQNGPQIDSQYSITLGTYDYTQFDPPHAQFFQPTTFADLGNDTNGNAFFDELILAFDVTINEPGYYYVDGALRNPLNGDSRSERSQTSYVLSPGPVSFTISFPGSWVWAQHLDNIRFSVNYISIQETDQFNNFNKQWDYMNDPAYNTDPYNSTDFEPPQARFTGNFLENLIDTDLDGQTNILTLSVQIDITATVSSDYSLEGELFYGTESNSANYYLNDLGAGVYWIDIDFVTARLYETFIDQAYDFSLELYSHSENMVIDRINNQTSFYNYLDFDPFSAYFTGNFYDQGIDSDASGKFDYVELLIEVNITDDASFTFNCWLSSSGGGQGWDYYSPLMSLTFGVQNLTVQIDKEWFWNVAGGNTVYLEDLSIREQLGSFGEFTADYEYPHHPFANIYQISDFDVPSAYFMDNFYDQGIDSDASGWFNYVEFKIEVNITQAGQYSIDGYIDSDGPGSGWWYRVDRFSIILPCMFNFTIQIPKEWFYSNENGTDVYNSRTYLYEYNVTSDNDLEIGYTDENYYFSKIYYHRDFDLRAAWITGIIDDYVTDKDSNGLLDFWIVIFEVEVTVTGLNLNLYATLEEQMTGRYITDGWLEAYDLAVGRHNLTMIFISDQIYQSGFLQGAQISHYSLYGGVTEWDQLDESYDYHPLSGNYIYSDFDPNKPNEINIASITPMFGIFFVDDSILFEVTIYRLGGEIVTSMEIEISVKGFAYKTIALTKTDDYENYEKWSVTLVFDRSGIWVITINAHSSDGTTETGSISYHVLGGPVFLSNEYFAVNSSSVKPGGAIKFDADVWDNDSVKSLTLNIGGDSYSMDYVGDGTYGELWTVTVTFNIIGEFIASITAEDGIGDISISGSRTIYVNEGPEIISVDVSPSNTVDFGTTVTFTVVFEKTDVIISSVTLDIQHENGTNYKIALTQSAISSTTITYSGIFKPDTAGKHTCTIRALTTLNVQSSHVEILTVRGEGENINITPGFELMIVLVGLLVLLPISRKKLS